MSNNQIEVDIHGWINPTCPHCECVMEFNYCSWVREGKQVSQYPNLNLYCRRCHFGVHVKPTVIVTEMPDMEMNPKFTQYSGPGIDYLDGEEE